MAVMIEHFAGNFPVWLSPTQIKIIPVRENHNDYSKKISDELKALDIRVEFDDKLRVINEDLARSKMKTMQRYSDE